MRKEKRWSVGETILNDGGRDNGFARASGADAQYAVVLRSALQGPVDGVLLVRAKLHTGFGAAREKARHP